MDRVSECYPKFPKETRNAVISMLCNKRECMDERKSNSMVKDSQTQTSPNISTTRVYPAFKIPKNFKKIPCPKNLLCERGLHAGKCGSRVVKKQVATFCKIQPCHRQHYEEETVQNDNFSSGEFQVAGRTSVESFLRIMEPKNVITTKVSDQAEIAGICPSQSPRSRCKYIFS